MTWRARWDMAVKNKMRIGILTFHRAQNYGALLQCYALQETLKSLGHDVRVIDYNPRYFREDYAAANFRGFASLSAYRRARRIIGIILLFVPRMIRRAAFLKGMKSCLELDGRPFSDIGETDLSVYDAIFFGSDQIWNPKITRGFDSVFWGDFNFQGRKIACAASAGDDFSVLESEVESVKNLLSNFSSVSVRESRLGEFLIDRCDVLSKTVLDPTLLLDSGRWGEFAGDGRTGKKYLLLYVVSPSPEARKIARKIARGLRLRVREIFSHVSLNPMSWLNALCPPSDFVRLFRDAEFVVTTSFHGTSFAVNFHREFYAVNNGKPNFRVEALLSEFGLMDRYIQSESEANLRNKVEYAGVQRRLETERKKSFSFIANSIGFSEV